MDKKILTMLAMVLLLVLSLFLSGCGGAEPANASTSGGAETASNEAEGDADERAEGDDDEAEEDKEEAVPVEVAELTRGPIESVLSFSSNLETESQVQVFSQAKRLVTQLRVEEGDNVRRGQVLLRLQDDEQRGALAKVESQLEKAEREYERQKRLFAQELVSEQAFNDATYELEQLQISLEDARRELGYTEVVAPISGTVAQRLVNLGDQVQIGQHLFDLVDFNSMVARIYVPEKHLDALRTGLPVRLSSQSSEDRAYDCEVKRIAPVVDPRSGTVKVTVDVGGQPGLRPGMYVDVEMVMATNAEAVLVPKRALIYDNDQVFVYRLTDDRRVERIFLEASLSDKYNIEPAGGVSAGDRIVVAGQAGLKDGALVRLPGDEDDEDDPEDETTVAKADAETGR